MLRAAQIASVHFQPGRSRLVGSSFASTRLGGTSTPAAPHTDRPTALPSVPACHGVPLAWSPPCLAACLTLRPPAVFGLVLGHLCSFRPGDTGKQRAGDPATTPAAWTLCSATGLSMPSRVVPPSSCSPGSRQRVAKSTGPQWWRQRKGGGMASLPLTHCWSVLKLAAPPWLVGWFLMIGHGRHGWWLAGASEALPPAGGQPDGARRVSNTSQKHNKHRPKTLFICIFICLQQRWHILLSYFDFRLLGHFSSFSRPIHFSPPFRQAPSPDKPATRPNHHNHSIMHISQPSGHCLHDHNMYSHVFPPSPPPPFNNLATHSTQSQGTEIHS